MNIFIIGLPNSGRTTMAKALLDENTAYVDASLWVKHTFRERKENEPISTYQDEFFNYLSNRLKINPDLYYNNVIDAVKSIQTESFDNIIIDGINSPHDLVKLFNYNEDYIVFMNRTDNDTEFKDHENIGVSVIRDYCYWMSSINLLPKSRWIEYNFKLMGDDSDQVKILGSKNSVFIVKTLKRAISHFKETILNRQDPQ